MVKRYLELQCTILKPKVAFDVDNTLVDDDGEPREKVVQLFKLLQEFGCEMYVWSTGLSDTTGAYWEDYAKETCERLGLTAKCVPKGSFRPDITVDDLGVYDRISELTLGLVNIKV